MHDPSTRGVPGGVALSADGTRLYAADVFGQDVAMVDVQAGRATGLVPFLAGVAPVDLTPDATFNQPGCRRRGEASGGAARYDPSGRPLPVCSGPR